MTFWDWANAHWLVSGIVILFMAFGVYEIMSGFGKLLRNMGKRRSDR